MGEALETAGEYRLPCELLLNCAAPSMDPSLFLALDQAGLVFDGRLVVDATFRTADTNMYGTCVIIFPVFSCFF